MCRSGGVDLKLQFDANGLQGYLEGIFPQVAADFTVERLSIGQISMRLNVTKLHLRPGGTVSGPAMFTLGDVTVYGLVLAHVGRQALAVTTNVSLDFLRKPAGGADLIAEGELMKLGRSLAVGDVRIFSEGVAEPVARATMTYSIPPQPA